MIKKIGFCILIVFSLSRGQYFGRNKVQFETFDFKVLESENLHVHYYPSQEVAATDAALMLERWNERLRRIFNRSLPENQPIILYSNHAHFQQTNAVGILIPQSTGGLTEGFFNRVIVPLTGVYSENDHVLGHELVHAFQFEIMRAAEAGLAGSAAMPLWFVEGMAEYLSIGSRSPHTAMWIRDAVMRDDMPDFADIGRYQRYFPYRYGHAVMAYIAGIWGDEVMGTLFSGVLRHGWYGGYRRVLGSPLDSLSKEWAQSSVAHFTPTLKGRTPPDEVGRLVIGNSQTNISPVLSPDGSTLAFLSTIDIFSIDLFLADVKTGHITRKLVSSQTDEHFDALRFFNSAGAWSPDGTKIAVVVFRQGRNDLAIVDVQTGNVEEVQSLGRIEELTGLAWSPDSRYMAVSGTVGGISNLYLYDIERDSLRALTDNRNAQLQPSWSPDGTMIAFVTDDNTETDFDSLVFAPMQIGLFDLQNNETYFISIAPWAKHINPQFSSDGRSLFMISDPDGVSDIYRYSFDDVEVYRVTKVATGVSGLTELSPSMSLSWGTGDMAFSVFSKGEYQIHLIESDNLHGERFEPQRGDYERVVSLPPAHRYDHLVDQYLGNATDGLPERSSFSVQDYWPRLRLLYVGQLFAGIVADRYGVGVGGGVSFLFSDLLGDHILGLGVQISGSISDIGAEGLYMNMRRRTNFGLNLSRIPYLSTRITGQRSTEVIDGVEQTVDNFTITEQRVYENRLRMFLEYPFSTNRRIEFGAGLTRFSYDYRAEELRFRDGIIDDQAPVSVDDPPSLNLIQGSAAYVGDFSFFGFTAPVSGSRFRYEIEPTSGTLSFLALLADYRHYYFVNPVTFAYRFIHYGRYLGDSESSRLSPLFVGMESWVRGYSAFTYNLRSCTGEDDFSDCPEFDRLLGSRIGVVNLEMRLPLFGIEQYGLLNFPYLPVDLVAFIDGGVAWRKGETPELRWERENSSARVPVFSTGAAARVNILGLLILQIYYAYPFQRPDYGGHWGFVFAPGW